MITSDELIEKIVDEIEKLGIDVKFADLAGAGAYVSYKHGAAIIDPYQTTPFGVCHEYFHAKHKDSLRCSEYDWNNPCERRADREAILYLWRRFVEASGTINDLTRFLDITECPRDFAKLTIRNQMEEDCTRKEMEEKITDYLMHTDEDPETWNLYRIMDALLINRQWELIVASLILEIGSVWIG